MGPCFLSHNYFILKNKFFLKNSIFFKMKTRDLLRYVWFHRSPGSTFISGSPRCYIMEPHLCTWHCVGARPCRNFVPFENEERQNFSIARYSSSIFKISINVVLVSLQTWKHVSTLGQKGLCSPSFSRSSYFSPVAPLCPEG